MKYSDIVDRPAYKAPDKCPICGGLAFEWLYTRYKNNGRWRNGIRLEMPEMLL